MVAGCIFGAWAPPVLTTPGERMPGEPRWDGPVVVVSDVCEVIEFDVP